MEDEETIISNLVKQLTDVINNNKVKVKPEKDQTELRGDYMVVIGIDDVSNINPGLKDYKIVVSILIDFFINEDKEGYFFNQTKNQVWNFIESEYLKTRMNLTNIEEGIVGCFLNDKKNLTDLISNKLLITLLMISSKD